MRRQMVTTMYDKYNYPTLPSPSLSSMVTTISSSAKTKCTENVAFYNEVIIIGVHSCLQFPKR